MTGPSFSIPLLLQRVFNEEEKVIDLNKLFDQKLGEYGITKGRVVKLLNIDLRTLDDTLQGKAKQPNVINVLKIAHFLGLTDLSEVIAAILKNQEADTIKSIERSTKVSFLAKNFDIKRLSSIGFFDNSDDTDNLVNRALGFFGYNSVLEYERDMVLPFYSRAKRKFSDKMVDFWVKSAYACFNQINNPNEYDRDALKDLIVKIRPYTLDVENGLFTVCRALYSVGVTVIFQNQLTTTQIRGATFVINDKPCVVITDLGKRYTTVWYALIHELHHVLYDMESIQVNNYHLSGDSDLLLVEDKANSFALEYFCSQEQYKYLAPHIGNKFLVSKFAKEVELHPAFIYATYLHYQDQKGINEYAKYSVFLPDCAAAIKKLNPITWKEESLPEVALKIKEIFEINF